MRVAPSLWQWTIIAWFAPAVAMVTVENVVFYLQLRRLGVPLSFVFSGTPVYLDAVYLRWCHRESQPPNKVRLRLRRILLVNAILAAIAFVLMVLALLPERG